MSATFTPGQRFILQNIDNPTERHLCLKGKRLQSLRAVQRKGLVSFNSARGLYELTPAGREAAR